MDQETLKDLRACWGIWKKDFFKEEKPDRTLINYQSYEFIQIIVFYAFMDIFRLLKHIDELESKVKVDES